MMAANNNSTTVEAASQRGHRRRSSHATAGCKPTATMIETRTSVRMYQMRMSTETIATDATIFSRVDHGIRNERDRLLSAINGGECNHRASGRTGEAGMAGKGAGKG